MADHRDPVDPGNVRSAADGEPSSLTFGDWLISLAATGVLLLHCFVRSPRRLFWTDEVYTEVVIRGASLTEVLASLHEPINAVPPSYLIGLWLWGKAFGTSDLAMHMFSAVAMSCAWIFCWLLLRRFCSRLTATTAATTGLVCSQYFMIYNAEARGYAQYMAAFFAAGLLFVLCWNRPKHAGAAILAGTFVAQALLVTTHYVGCIYSAALIGTAILAAALTRRRVLVEYAIAAAAGAATFVFCIPFYLGQRTLGGANNWLTAPSVPELIKAYGFESQSKIPLLALVLAMIAFALVVTRRSFAPTALLDGPPSPDDGAVSRAPAAILQGVFAFALTVLAVPLAIWVESIVGMRLFLERYLLPSIIIWPCILALALDQLETAAHHCRRIVGGRPGRLAGQAATLCCVLFLLFSAFDLAQDARILDVKLVETLAMANATNELGIDLASIDLNEVLQVRHYGGRTKYIRIEGGNQLGSHKVSAEAIERRYWNGFIIPSDELAQGNWRFLVRRAEWPKWQEQGVAGPEWRVEKHADGNLLVVER